MTMKSDQLHLVNIDVCNEEIQRVCAKLGVAPPKFIGRIDKANEKLDELNAELAKRKTPTAKADDPILPTPTTKTVVPPVTKQPPQRQLHGLEFAIAANIAVKDGKPVHTTKSNYQPTGLMRAVAANVAQAEAKKKSKSNE
jgi:hypothetical protein